MPRLKTIAAFGVWILDPANVEDILRRVADCGKLQKVCLDIKQPYTLVHPHLHSTPELKARYEAARAAWADALHDEALDIADKVAPEQGPVSKAKLQCDVRFQSAKAYNRDRFGDEKGVAGGGITVVVDRSCGGAVRVGVQDAGGNKAAVQISSPEALPAPAEKSA